MTVRVVNPPPTYEKIADADGNVTSAWLQFFDQVYGGDQGRAWTPTANSLGSVGTPVLTGTIYQISKKLVFFNLLITPGTNTTSTAGTTYFTGLPVIPFANGFCTAQSSNLGDPTGEVLASSGRIYTPAWSAITVPVTVTGVIEAS